MPHCGHCRVVAGSRRCPLLHRYAASALICSGQAFWVQSIAAPHSGHGLRRTRVFSIPISQVDSVGVLVVTHGARAKLFGRLRPVRRPTSGCILYSDHNRLSRCRSQERRLGLRRLRRILCAESRSRDESTRESTSEESAAHFASCVVATPACVQPRGQPMWLFSLRCSTPWPSRRAGAWRERRGVSGGQLEVVDQQLIQRVAIRRVIGAQHRRGVIGGNER